MASVKVIRPPVCTDAASEVPRSQWSELLTERRNFCNQVIPRDCRLLLFFIDDANKSEWLGYGSREAYLRDGLGLDPQQVAWAVDGLRQLKPDEPIEYAWAQKLGKHGGDRRSKKAKTSSVAPHLKGSGSIERILARLDRDGEKELATKVRAGELSGRAVEKKLGWRKNRCPKCGYEW